MDRQMERGLFGNDSAIKKGTESTREPVVLGQQTSVMACKSRKEDSSKEGKVTLEGLRAILIQQSYRCALSGVMLSPDIAELDHKKPLSRGGTHTLGNLQIVHPVVNRLKMQMENDEFIGWCKLIASNTNE